MINETQMRMNEIHIRNQIIKIKNQAKTRRNPKILNQTMIQTLILEVENHL